jgi:RNA polymerase sigma factor (sigma-70 family)
VPPTAVSDLVTRARDGDEQAWVDLVDRYLGLVHAICRGFRLGAVDAADVNLIVWLRLVEHLGRFASPDAVGGWIAATTRNECLRVLRGAGPLALTDETALPEVDVRDMGIDAGLLVYERDRALLAAVNGLDEECQRLLRLLVVDPPASDDEIAAALDVPAGSVGPAGARCLGQLRRALR